ncbi:multicopper oxidase [Aspergillus carbonarius ITEM 5010]|uniref:Multicopper oxidase n=1 Tax=Aspergillus carbonarius (strain ITEM 5010) TaxID=602072 RepID=A0A1R3RLF1_ASPC5|nr:multicopper oxidase [Aspergillus carbonarius ITEM 5010]
MRVRHWSWKLVLYPATICGLMFLVFLMQILTPNPLQGLIPSKAYTNQTLSTTHNPDIARPIIELHPENHVYRNPVAQHFNWEVTADYVRPDGVLKRVYLVNGLFPGPTVEARSGDRLIINVTNLLEDESISVHWHGLHTENAMDGAVGVTQHPILPGSTFTYNFTIPADQSGTFWYHAHSGLIRADGLYGGLIVHAPSPKTTVRGLLARADDNGQDGYSRDILLLVGDWYHRSADQVYSWYMRAGSFGNEPVPDSLLINGNGRFDCSMAVPARPVDCINRQMNLSYLDANDDTTYRVRIVNTGSVAGFTLGFQNRDFTLIQVDNIDVEPQDSNSAGILYPGQRMDVILRPGVNNLPSSMAINLDNEYPNPALSSAQTFAISKSQGDPPQISPSKYTTMFLSDVATKKSLLSTLPEKSQQTHVVYTKIEKLSRNHNIPYGFFNRTSWKPPIGTPLINLPREEWDENQLVISSGASTSQPNHDKGIWIDLVVNNLDDSGHPFHLHGHHFYILTTYKAPIGWGAYNPFTDATPPGLAPQTTTSAKAITPYDLSRAQLRDTVYIPSRGYAVLRFRADNPGIWLFHCHIIWHQASGMAMLLQID